MQSFEIVANNPIRTAFDCTDLPVYRTIRNSTYTNSNTQFGYTLGLVGIKTNDREFLNWYLKKVKSP